MKRLKRASGRKEKKMRTFRHILRNIILILLVIVLLAFMISFVLSFIGTSRYIVRHGDLINKVAAEEKIDNHLLAAIVRTESDFKENVVANDGGMGLTQLMPETAKEKADELGIEYSREKIMDPETNLRIGSHYISQLIQKYQNLDLAIAAYNVGPSKVDKWLKDGVITWERESMENIPAPITRAYVKKVNKAKEIYSVIYPDKLPNSTANTGRLKRSWDNLRSIFSWAVRQVK